MNLFKHACPQCGAELQFPEELPKVYCASCRTHFMTQIYEQIVVLKPVDPTSIEDEADLTLLNQLSPNNSLAENIQILDREIEKTHRMLVSRRSSASSSLVIAFLFSFFSLATLLLNRGLMALFCGTIATVMIGVTGTTLRDSARSRNSLAKLMNKREELAQLLRPIIPRIY